MLQTLRISGFLMMGAGMLIVLSWAIAPLRQLWPLFFGLPMPVRIGLVVAAIGLIVLMGSLIAERIAQRRSEGNLLDDDQM